MQLIKTLLFLHFLAFPSAVLAQTRTAYISMYCNAATSFFTVVCCSQFKKQEIWITHYTVSDLR